MAKLRTNVKKRLFACSALWLFSINSSAIAQTSRPAISSQNEQNLYFSQNDRLNYQRGFGFAAKGDEIALNAAITLIADKILVPDLQRELYKNKPNTDKSSLNTWLIANSDNANASEFFDYARKIYPDYEFARPSIQSSRRSFARIRAPQEARTDALSSASVSERQAYTQLRTQFNTNDDYEVINIAQANIESPASGAFSWFGGLSAYRIGDFEKSLSFFTISANSRFNDESKKSAAFFWAARAANRLKRSDVEAAMLEQAAQNPLSFYGQLALQKLGRWESLSIPEQKGETQAAKEILASSENARRAIALFDLGRFSEAQNELAMAWNNANSSTDLGYLYIAQILGFKDLVSKISEISNSAYIAGNYPIAHSLTPKGGSFVLDRALIYSIMRQESRFKSGAVSYAGARGLMQLMPATAAWMTGRSELRSNPDLLHDNELNITLGEAYIERLLKMRQIDNSLARTLMAYNAGPGAVSRWLNSIEMSEDTLLFIEATPVSETREYVKKVMSNLWIYHKRLGQNAPSLARLAVDQTPDYEPQDSPRFSTQKSITSLMR